jgi:hypothetical protein
MLSARIQQKCGKQVEICRLRAGNFCLRARAVRALADCEAALGLQPNRGRRWSGVRPAASAWRWPRQPRPARESCCRRCCGPGLRRRARSAADVGRRQTSGQCRRPGACAGCVDQAEDRVVVEVGRVGWVGARVLVAQWPRTGHRIRGVYGRQQLLIGEPADGRRLVHVIVVDGAPKPAGRG